MGVFISYRRDDSEASAGRLYETLSNAIGAEQLYKDVDNIALGKDFRTEIERAIRASEVLVPVIGSEWGSEEGLARLHEEDDYVRQEIAQALRYGLVILPVMVDGATMPEPEVLPADIAAVVYRNAASLSHDTWHRDAQDLIAALRDVLSIEAESVGPNATDPTLRLDPTRILAPHPKPELTAPVVMGRSRKPPPFSERRSLLLALSIVTIAVALVAVGFAFRGLSGDGSDGEEAEESVAGPSAVDETSAPATTTASSTEGTASLVTASSTIDPTTTDPTTTVSSTTDSSSTDPSPTKPSTSPPKPAPCNVVVPDVEGATVAEAAQSLSDAGLDPATGSVAESNLVTAADPTAGSKVCRGATIRIDSCAAALVPHIVGWHVDSYGAELTRAGLVPGGVSSEFSDQTGQDFVVRTSPAAGERVCSGAKLDVVLSAGPPPCFVVPDVRGMVAEEAMKLLQSTDARFDVALDYGYIPEGEYEVGTIFWQPYIGNVFDCVNTEHLRLEITVVAGFVP